MLDTISTVRTGTDNRSEPQQECSGRVDPKMRVRADNSKFAHSKYLIEDRTGVAYPGHIYFS